ncbi:MAG: FeoC-like transcriptional regulator [Chlorobium sp.]|nr:FeoC-like transcriptional regulator [Chlorobium sp.]MCF8272086.1 FeoC-like transcriptional regulator [Chlorobium sp.]MCF8288447.1 FeoC-like transcriptional regulator [Chlorobium sp.]MCF8292037.1 FeoC-like transcriptional regulator [Chlorobium sp.]MCF8386128.1 FeoC-like transcriptional regulator [Chlorobium sp.]
MHASIGEIARHFGSDQAMIEVMIDEWIRKGKVEKKAQDSFSHACCGKCGTYRSNPYRWIGG